MNDTWHISTRSLNGETCVEARTVWAKSTYSTGENNCVEVGRTTGKRNVQVRDTKDRGRGIITVGAQAWEKFIAM